MILYWPNYGYPPKPIRNFLINEEMVIASFLRLEIKWEYFILSIAKIIWNTIKNKIHKWVKIGKVKLALLEVF